MMRIDNNKVGKWVGAGRNTSHLSFMPISTTTIAVDTQTFPTTLLSGLHSLSLSVIPYFKGVKEG